MAILDGANLNFGVDFLPLLTSLVVVSVLGISNYLLGDLCIRIRDIHYILICQEGRFTTRNDEWNGKE